jgi:hypothetical protein
MKRNNVLGLPPLYIIKLILIASIICYFISCAPSKDQQHKNNIAAATKYTAKALKKDTSTVLATIRLLAPCITTVVKINDTAYNNWLAGLGKLPEPEIINDSIIIHDSIPVYVNGNCAEMISGMSVKMKGLQNALIKRNERNKLLENKISYIANNPPPPIYRDSAWEDKTKLIDANIVIREQGIVITDLEKKLATKKATAKILGIGCGILFLGIIFLTWALIKNRK